MRRIFAPILIALVMLGTLRAHAAAPATDETAELRKKLQSVKVNVDAQGKPFEEVLAAICDQAKMKLTIDPTPLEKGMLIPRMTFVASSCELGTALY